MIQVMNVEVGDIVAPQEDVYDSVNHALLLYKGGKRYRVLHKNPSPKSISLMINCESGIDIRWFGYNYNGSVFKFISVKQERKAKLESIWR